MSYETTNYGHPGSSQVAMLGAAPASGVGGLGNGMGAICPPGQMVDPRLGMCVPIGSSSITPPSHPCLVGYLWSNASRECRRICSNPQAYYLNQATGRCVGICPRGTIGFAGACVPRPDPFPRPRGMSGYLQTSSWNRSNSIANLRPIGFGDDADWAGWKPAVLLTAALVVFALAFRHGPPAPVVPWR